ncbi:hypothetical protein NMG60_11003448 [Bertholletia excelsa]
MEASGSSNEINSDDSTPGFLAKESSELAIDIPQMDLDMDFQEPRKIERVPLLLRNSQSNNKDYNPKMVSIGPYHHGKVELQEAERVKLVIAKLFVAHSGKTLNELCGMILPIVNDLKSCYAEVSLTEYSAKKFATMMLLDGCLVLAFIELNALPFEGQRRSYMDEIKRLGMHAWTCFISDIRCLVENQLPFRVLQLLLNLIYKGDDGMKMINTYLNASIDKAIKAEVHVSSILAKQQPLHLLELTIMTSRLCYSRRKKRSSKPQKKQTFLEYLHFFRSISELKAKGIFVRCSGSPSPTSVKFKSFFFFGLLDLPSMIISLDTRVVLSNIIAYELTTGDENMLLQLSFINLMKSLINHPEDVEELRSKHILRSEHYSSDEEVVKIVNSITTFPMEFIEIYEEVKESIQRHYNSKAKTWIAQFIHIYFSSPWAFIAFLGAIFAMALTCIQTYFTIFPRH